MIIEFMLSYPEGTELHARCVSMKPKSKNRWKLTCEGGKWIGEPHVCGKPEILIYLKWINESLILNL